MAENDTEVPKLRFDPTQPEATDVVRQALLDRLRWDKSFTNLNLTDSTCDYYVEFVTERPEDRERFRELFLDVFWELVVQGVITPGNGDGSVDVSVFHLTDHGKKAVSEPDYQPHNPAEYLRRLGQGIPSPDSTVLAYLQESLDCFAHGMMVASTTMLGIAAERVFILVCESLVDSLKDLREQAKFQKTLKQNAMKPKLDWLAGKFQRIQTPNRPPELPEDVDIKIPGIYNLIRVQRNDLGHPREMPPAITRDDAYGYLRIFPSYYATAEKVREFLTKHKV
jgi:hypothetical protein